MTTNKNLPPKFEGVRDNDEEIFWSGRPNFTVFLLTGIPFFIFGLIWLIGGYFFSIQGKLSNDDLFGIVFYLTFFLPPFCFGVFYMIYLVLLVYNNVFYAITNKRLMIRSGIFGTDFKAIDYDKISDIEVNVNPIENLLGVGSIQLFTYRIKNDKYDTFTFIGIKNPYKIFKKIKEISTNIKIDWNYPNHIRPQKNNGYRTKYIKK